MKLHLQFNFVCFFMIIYFSLFYSNPLAEVAVKVYMKDEAVNESNITKPRIYIKNIGSESISNFYLCYYFTTENGGNPILDDYYTPNSSVSIENLGGGDYLIKYDFSGVTLYPGSIVPTADGNVVGLHYNDWSI